jgi:hypothetical protein
MWFGLDRLQAGRSLLISQTRFGEDEFASC